MSQRRYSEKEVARILERAAELSEQREGATLEELERIAIEAGLDPAAVRQAAVEAEIDETATSSTIAGGPTRLIFERTFDGEIAGASIEELDVAIRTVFPTAQSNVVGRNVTYVIAEPKNGKRLQITVSIIKGKTVVRAEERLSGLVGLIYGVGIGAIAVPTVPWIGVGAGFALGPVAAVGVTVAGFVAFYAACRALYSKAASFRRERLREAFESVCAVLNERQARTLEDAKAEMGIAAPPVAAAPVAAPPGVAAPVVEVIEDAVTAEAQTTRRKS